MLPQPSDSSLVPLLAFQRLVVPLCPPSLAQHPLLPFLLRLGFPLCPVLSLSPLVLSLGLPQSPVFLPW